MVLHGSMINWGGPSSMHIFAFFYMWNLFGVVVLHGCMIDWRGSICHAYICILLYVKLMQCSGVEWIYDQLMGGSICQVYICILPYVKLIWCSGVAWIYGWLEEGVGSICYGYMCILVYMKPMWCHGFPEIYAQLEEGWGQSAMGICEICYIWNIFGVMVFQRSMLNWRRGGVNLPWVYMKSAICET